MMIGKPKMTATQHEAEMCMKNCEVSSRLVTLTLNEVLSANSGSKPLADATVSSSRYRGKSP